MKEKFSATDFKVSRETGVWMESGDSLRLSENPVLPIDICIKLSPGILTKVSPSNSPSAEVGSTASKKSVSSGGSSLGIVR